MKIYKCRAATSWTILGRLTTHVALTLSGDIGHYKHCFQFFFPSLYSFNTYQTFESDVASQVSRFFSLKENQDRILADVAEFRNEFSGVNLDEEAANLLRFQQSYQAAAEYISVQNRLLELLFQIVSITEENTL